jgi:hypothetical protein
MRQEAANAWGALRPPRLRQSLAETPPVARLPRPEPIFEALRGSPFAGHVSELAASICEHRFPLMGLTVETGPEIRWRRDYTSGIETSSRYFRRIPYLDAAHAGDHKLVWELNRHQHLVVLAMAWGFTGRSQYLEEITAQAESWMAADPFARGINWASALEVAFRALSWVWVWHLCGQALPAGFRRRLVEGIWLHGRYLENNLSIYFSPNTHLLGEAVALHAIGALFPGFPQSRRWEGLGSGLVREQLAFQVRADGSHFEQSSYYHVYALDLFLFHAALLPELGEAFRERLGAMAEYLRALMGPAGCLPFLGDDDGGRLFHPYGDRSRFGRSTLATAAALLGEERHYAPEDAAEQAAWWLGPPALADLCGPAPSAGACRLFPDAGLAVMEEGDAQVIVDVGPFGWGSAGHSHSDTLSLVLRTGTEEILIDPGTFTYVGDPHWRAWFRGSSAHNTLRLDGQDQAIAAGPFRWRERPEVVNVRWTSQAGGRLVEATCRYRGFSHRRRVWFRPPAVVLVIDDVAGPPGEHTVEQFWHAGAPVAQVAPDCFRIGGKTRLLLPASSGAEVSEGGTDGWRSEVMAARHPAPVVRIARRAFLPCQLAAVFDLAGEHEGFEAESVAGVLRVRIGAWRIEFDGSPAQTVY